MSARRSPYFLVFAALFWCFGCTPKSDVLQRVRSPDGQLDAIMAQPRTGATVGFVSWVYIVPAGKEPKGEPFFIADHVSPSLYLDWSGNGLAIRAQHARVFKSTRQVQTGGAMTRVAVQIADPER